MNNRRLKKYKLPDYRFRELRNAVFQYPEWKERVAEKTELTAVNIDGLPHGGGISDPTAQGASRCENELRKIRIVNQCSRMCAKDSTLQNAVLKGATTPGVTFNWLKQRGYVFHERDAYYIARARFYFLLDKFWI